MAAASTAEAVGARSGRPRRVLFFSAPPVLVKSPGAGLDVAPRLEVPPFSSSCRRRAYASSLSICCFFSLGGFRAWMAFLTRMISPSRSPIDRRVDDSMSGRMDSSILSRSKAWAYRVQSSMSHPAERKNSNQSILGFLEAAGRAATAGDDLPAVSLETLEVARDLLGVTEWARGMSSSFGGVRCCFLPVTRSM